jgi:hypothetical protein
VCLYYGQQGFRARYTRECQLVTVYQDIADSLNEGVRTAMIIIDFSKAIDLAPHDRLLTKIARVVVLLKGVRRELQ